MAPNRAAVFKGNIRLIKKSWHSLIVVHNLSGTFLNGNISHFLNGELFFSNWSIQCFPIKIQLYSVNRIILLEWLRCACNVLQAKCCSSARFGCLPVQLGPVYYTVCNRKSSAHCWGSSSETIKNLLDAFLWQLKPSLPAQNSLYEFAAYLNLTKIVNVHGIC